MSVRNFDGFLSTPTCWLLPKLLYKKSFLLVSTSSSSSILGIVRDQSMILKLVSI